MAFVTVHAAQRYVERCEPSLTVEQARAAIMRSATAIDVAAKFGATAVKLANGARLALQGDVVATVKQSQKREHCPASHAMKKRWRRHAENR